ncbi:MAG TPA: universal stress protein [Solirubrobacteraceae bacterium]
MFTKVIWATDGSEHADRGLAYAVGVATRDGAELHVVHVVEKLAGARASGLDARADEDEVKAKIERQAAALAADGDVTPIVHIVRGRNNHVADRIAEIAEHVGADLIVVGTRGHGTVGSLVLGSVTQRLMHVSGTPVLAVPPSAAQVAAILAETVGTPA